MQTIAIKSNSPETVIPLLTAAIEREKRILADSLRMTREKVARLAKSLNVDVDRLMKGEVEHAEADDMMLVELEGEVEILRHLEEDIRELEAVRICR